MSLVNGLHFNNVQGDIYGGLAAVVLLYLSTGDGRFFWRGHDHANGCQCQSRRLRASPISGALYMPLFYGLSL